ncbi:MAG: hypothetical protein ACYTG2_06930 [Planctomycetota bacterium]|jgi:hypothetical protein
MPYDGLLREMGGTGFPTLMFLDADGRRILKHAGPRTVKGFEKSLEEVQDFLDLAKKAEAGDDKAATAVLLRQLELGWWGLDEARERRDALKTVSSKQKKEFEQLLIDTEVRSLAAAVEEDEAHIAAGKHFAAMWAEKRIPRADAERSSFWWAIAAYAEHEGDKKTFKRVIGEYDDLVDDNSRYRNQLLNLEERLEDFPKE